MAELFNAAFGSLRANGNDEQGSSVIPIANISSSIEALLAAAVSGHRDGAEIVPSSSSLIAQRSESLSWSTEPYAIGNKENSVAIQPLTKVDTVWKGDEWSHIPVRLKLHSSFLNLFDQAKRKDLVVTCAVESARSGTLFGHDNEKVEIVFRDEGKEEDGNVCIADGGRGPIKPNTMIDVSVHRSCFAADDYFFVRVDVTSLKDCPIPKDLAYFGRTEPIRVARYTLSLTHHFMKNKHTVHLVDQYYAWFAKSGGGALGLEAEVSMLDEDGSTVKHYACKVPLETELIYSDGIPAPERVVNAKANLRGNKAHLVGKRPEEIAQKLRLFHELSPNLCLGPGRTSQRINFRIEEVSFHHAAHAGFKIKVSIADSGQMNVRPAILQESIVVLSKPKSTIFATGSSNKKSEQSKKPKQSGEPSSAPTTAPSTKNQNTKMSRPETRSKKRKIVAASKKTTAKHPRKRSYRKKAVSRNGGDRKMDCTDMNEISDAKLVSESSFVTDDSEVIADASTFDPPSMEQTEKCKGCGRFVTIETFFCEESHESHCYIVAKTPCDVAQQAYEAKDVLVEGNETDLKGGAKLLPTSTVGSRHKEDQNDVQTCMSLPTTRIVSSDQNIFRPVPGTVTRQKLFSPLCLNAPSQQHPYDPPSVPCPSHMFSPFCLTSTSQQFPFHTDLQSQVMESSHLLHNSSKMVHEVVLDTVDSQDNAFPYDLATAIPERNLNNGRYSIRNMNVLAAPKRLFESAEV